MNSQQESMQKAFKEEQDMRFQNQGEVGILRKKMEKVCTGFGCNTPPSTKRPFELISRSRSSRRNITQVRNVSELPRKLRKLPRHRS